MTASKWHVRRKEHHDVLHGHGHCQTNGDRNAARRFMKYGADDGELASLRLAARRPPRPAGLVRRRKLHVTQGPRPKEFLLVVRGFEAQRTCELAGNTPSAARRTPVHRCAEPRRLFVYCESTAHTPAPGTRNHTRQLLFFLLFFFVFATHFRARIHPPKKKVPLGVWFEPTRRRKIRDLLQHTTRKFALGVAFG